MRRTLSSPLRWPRAGRPAGLVIANVVALVAATVFGMAVPSRAVLGDAVAIGDPDYAARTGEVAPLSEAFLTEVLGLPAARGADVVPVAGGGPGTSASGLPEGRTGGQGAVAPAPAGPTTVVHEPTNDDFDDSLVIAENQLPFTGTTTPRGATRQSGEAGDCGGSGGSLWYSLTADEVTGLVSQVTTNGGEVSLAVFRGDNLDDLTLVGCDSSLFGAATVSFQTRSDTRYHFQVVTTASRSSFSLDRLGTIALVNRTVDGERGDAPTKWIPNLSKNGRWVVFPTYAHLVPEDTNDLLDFYRIELGDDGRPVDVDLVTVAAGGGSADDHSYGSQAAISDDGRWVAFQSAATNLTDERDTNDHEDVFLRDMERGETRRITRRRDGGEAQLAQPLATDSGWPAFQAYCNGQDEATRNAAGQGCTYLHQVDITPDGRYVVFETPLWGLVEGHGRAVFSPHTVFRGVVHDWQTYRYDRFTGAVELVSSDVDGSFMDAAGYEPSVSADGRWVAYELWNDEPYRPIEWDPDPYWQGKVVLKDMRTGAWTLVSRAHSTQEPANGPSLRPEVSADGRHVVFVSAANDMLAPTTAYQDTNDQWDVYAYDRVTGEMQLASLRGEASTQDPTSGTPGINTGSMVDVSNDGRYVVFIQRSLEELEAEDFVTFGCGNQVYRRDLVTRTTTQISIGQNGQPDRCSSGLGAMSGDGRRVVWHSNTDAWTEIDGGTGPETPWDDTYVFTASMPLASSVRR